MGAWIDNSHVQRMSVCPRPHVTDQSDAARCVGASARAARLLGSAHGVGEQMPKSNLYLERGTWYASVQAAD